MIQRSKFRISVRSNLWYVVPLRLEPELPIWQDVARGCQGLQAVMEDQPALAGCSQRLPEFAGCHGRPTSVGRIWPEVARVCRLSWKINQRWQDEPEVARVCRLSWKTNQRWQDVARGCQSLQAVMEDQPALAGCSQRLQEVISEHKASC